MSETGPVETLSGSLLKEMLDTRVAFDPAGRRVRLGSNLPLASLLKIQRLISQNKCTRTLEVGFAMGTSALAILYALPESASPHTIIDPNQSGEGPRQWSSVGLTMVSRAGFSKRIEFFEKPSYEILPQLAVQRRRFDFMLIDGWRSFDGLFVDCFYADLLLEPGGILVINDRRTPQVHHVCRFLETHKDYERLGPREGAPLNPLSRLTYRLRSQAADSWGSVQAYRKRGESRVHWAFFTSDFYPYFRVYRWWMRLRGLKAPHLLERPGVEVLDP